MIEMYDFEPKVLHIRYDRGHMDINTDAFMQQTGFMEIKKLLKVIRWAMMWDYHNEEAEKAIAAYCERYINEVKQVIPILKESIDQGNEKVKLNERLVRECTIVRDRYEKRSDGYKYHQEHLKDFEEKLSTAKETVRNDTVQLNRLNRMKTKYEKVLQIVRE